MSALRWMRAHLFETCVAASFGLHLGAWGVVWAMSWSKPPLPPIPVMDVDIRTPFRPRNPNDTRLPGRAKGAPAPAKKMTPGVTGPQPKPPPNVKPVALPVAPPPNAPLAVKPPVQAAVIQPPTNQPTEKQWVLPGQNTQKLEKPTLGAPAATPMPPAQVGAAPGGTGLGGEGGRGGSGGGNGTGDAIVNRPPRLVNADEIRKLMKQYYPDAERRLGREGEVIVVIDIGADGLVKAVSISGSSGAQDFDDAAQQIAHKMFFEPRLVRSIPAETKVRQKVIFQLGD